jgi:hypothetical protein
VFVLVAGLGSGCLTESNFNEKLARDFCQKMQECTEEQFDAQYSSIGECVDDSTTDEDPATTCMKAAGCTFDRAGARDCRQAVQESECGEEGIDWANSCTDIYECTAEQQAEFVECISDAE